MSPPIIPKPGTLFIVATPIGNLEDLTFRALRILKAVHLIAAEDTRTTRKLLRAYEVDTPLISLYDHNERWRSDQLVTLLEEGKDVAYVSEAGTPGISDPGHVLINRAIAHGIPVVPVPGPSAVLAALCVSGLPMDRFVFQGFLPASPVKRRQALAALKGEARTLVVYESPQRVSAALEDIANTLGDRPMVLARELTKLFEEVLRGTVASVRAALEGRRLKGEVTLVIAGAPKEDLARASEAMPGMVAEMIQRTELSGRDIAARIAAETGLPKQTVYGEVIRQRALEDTDSPPDNP